MMKLLDIMDIVVLFVGLLSYALISSVNALLLNSIKTLTVYSWGLHLKTALGDYSPHHTNHMTYL